MGNPEVAKNFAGLAEYVDQAKFDDLLKEAGVVKPDEK
jgi:hypothetical protein